MKKIVASLLASFFVLGLIGCATPERPVSEDTLAAMERAMNRP